MNRRWISCVIALFLCLSMGTTALAKMDFSCSATAKVGENTVTIRLKGAEPGYCMGAVWDGEELLCLFDGETDGDGNWTVQVELDRTIQPEASLRVGVSSRNGEGAAWSFPVSLEPESAPDSRPGSSGGSSSGGGSSAGSSAGSGGGGSAVTQSTFGDVRKEDYFAVPVQWALTRNITSGVMQGRFGPELPCTRGQILTFLWRAAGSPVVGGEDLPFDDVTEDDYFAPAVRWAVARGITGGTGPDTFSPDAVCTRAQAVTLLYRAANGTAAGGASFRDVAEEDFFAAPVAWAVEREITSGVGGGCFGSDQPCTRGQIVTFLWKEFADA